jgi:hypothetical protein
MRIGSSDGFGFTGFYPTFVVGKDTISFMQGICTYIPETNHVPKEYNVAAILSLLFMVLTSCCVGSNVLLHQHFPKYVCSAQYGSFL